jgi:hypothetical protein
MWSAVVAQFEDVTDGIDLGVARDGDEVEA